MNEKLIDKKLVEGVKKLGGLALKFWTVSFSGFPDRMIIMPGAKVEFVELKTTGKKPSPIQSKVHGMLRKFGFKVPVIDTQILLDEFLNTLK